MSRNNGRGRRPHRIPPAAPASTTPKQEAAKEAPPAEEERIELHNAQIIGVALGVSDRDYTTCLLELHYGTAKQLFGGYPFDEPIKVEGHPRMRFGTAFGMEFIRRLLAVLELKRWEDLRGAHCRVHCSKNKVHDIGHILKDQWFSPVALQAEMQARETIRYSPVIRALQGSKKVLESVVSRGLMDDEDPSDRMALDAVDEALKLLGSSPK